MSKFKELFVDYKLAEDLRNKGYYEPSIASYVDKVLEYNGKGKFNNPLLIKDYNDGMQGLKDIKQINAPYLTH